MKAITRRVGKLEDRWGPKKPRCVLRIVVSRAGGGDADLAEATCTRYFCRDGMLMELVDLNGYRDRITNEELDRFVERFPIG